MCASDLHSVQRVGDEALSGMQMEETPGNVPQAPFTGPRPGCTECTRLLPLQEHAFLSALSLPFRMLHRSGRSAHLQQIHEKVRQEPGTEDTHKQHCPAGPAAIVAQGIPGHVNMPPEHVVRVPPCARQGGVLRAPCFPGPCTPSRACRSRIPRARLSTEACCLEFLIRLSTALWHACLRLSI